MSHLIGDTEHLIVDENQAFEINSITRKIRPLIAAKKTIMQYDHNSEIFTFVMPKEVEGHDMSECTHIEVHFIDKKSNKGLYPVNDLTVDSEDETKVKFTWLISKDATKSVGALAFLVRFACINDGTVLYDWHTDIFAGIYVSKGIDNTGAIIEQYSDALEKMKIDLWDALEYSMVSKLPTIGENGNWYLWDKETSASVDSGKKAVGVDGRTPVVGVDYYTAEEKQAITDYINGEIDGKEDKSNKSDTIWNNDGDNAYPTTNSIVRDVYLPHETRIGAIESELYWKEDNRNKVTSIDETANDLKYASALATKKFTEQKLAALVGSAPETLNTLNEIAAALGDDPNFATTILTELGKKEIASNRVTSFQETPDDAHYPSEKLLKDSLDAMDFRVNVVLNGTLVSADKNVFDIDEAIVKGSNVCCVDNNGLYYRLLKRTSDTTYSHIIEFISETVINTVDTSIGFRVLRADAFRPPFTDYGWSAKFLTLSGGNEYTSNKVSDLWAYAGDENAYPNAPAAATALMGIAMAKEDVANKVLSIDETSTDEQYASAKAIVNYGKGLVEPLETTDNKEDSFLGYEDEAWQRNRYPSVKGCVDFANSRGGLRLIKAVEVGVDSNVITINKDAQDNSFALTEAKIIINGTAFDNTAGWAPASLSISCKMSGESYRFNEWGTVNTGTAINWKYSYIMYIMEMGNLKSTCVANVNTLTGKIIGNTHFISNYGSGLDGASNYNNRCGIATFESVQDVPNITYFTFTIPGETRVIKAGTKIEIWGR